MEMSGQRQAPAALYPREWTPVPIWLEAGWISELVWTQRLEGKSFASAGDRSSDSIVSDYRLDCIKVALMLHVHWIV
jgi:hypothetical protein